MERLKRLVLISTGLINLSTLYLTNKPSMSAPVTGQESKERKPAIKALSAQELESLLGQRLMIELGYSFNRFARTFVVSSALKTPYSIVLVSRSPSVSAQPLADLYPSFYQPTISEILDQLSLQTGATWKYQTKSKGFEDKIDQMESRKPVVLIEFEEPKQELPYRIDLPKDWKLKEKTNSIMYIPPVCPFGVEIYQIGLFSSAEKSKEPALFTRIIQNVSIDWARKVLPNAGPQNFKSTKVGKYDALFFQTDIPTKTGYNARWRQWVLMADKRCYLIISTIFPNHEEKLFPQVEAMLKSFKLTSDKETAKK